MAHSPCYFSIAQSGQTCLNPMAVQRAHNLMLFLSLLNIRAARETTAWATDDYTSDNYN